MSAWPVSGRLGGRMEVEVAGAAGRRWTGPACGGAPPEVAVTRDYRPLIRAAGTEPKVERGTDPRPGRIGGAARGAQIPSARSSLAGRERSQTGSNSATSWRARGGWQALASPSIRLPIGR